jgi:nucleotide-binding universal stress UspA family protein
MMPKQSAPAPHNNLLIGVDGSDASLHAFSEGMRLADRDTRLVAVSVAPKYNGDLRLLGVQDTGKLIRQPCDAALSRCEAAARAAGVSLKTICALGQPYVRLVELAEEENSDLIVIGAKGLTSLKYALLGSVARKVIGFTSKDVLVVPAGVRAGWQQILLATDLSANSEGAENRALELALTYESELTILSVLELPTCLYGEVGELGCRIPEDRSQFLEDLQDQAASWGIKANTVVKQGDSAQIIVDSAKAVGAEVIVMGSHGRTGLTRLLMGSITEKVIGAGVCPVLVVQV